MGVYWPPSRVGAAISRLESKDAAQSVVIPGRLEFPVEMDVV